jgi:hypothetical protein
MLAAAAPAICNGFNGRSVSIYAPRANKQLSTRKSLAMNKLPADINLISTRGADGKRLGALFIELLGMSSFYGACASPRYSHYSLYCFIASVVNVDHNDYSSAEANFFKVDGRNFHEYVRSEFKMNSAYK